MVVRTDIAESLELRNRAKELVIDAVRPVLLGEQFDIAVRGSVATYVNSSEFKRAIEDAIQAALPHDILARAAQAGAAAAFKDPVITSTVFQTEFKQAIEAALPHDTLARAAQAGAAAAFKDPVVTSTVFQTEVKDAIAAALPHESLARAAQAGVGAAFKDPVVTATDFLSGGARVDKGTQILLVEKYRELVRNGSPLPSFADVGFRSFSQFDEDGILLFLFAVIGTTNREAIEICSGVGYECNSANLAIHHGWETLMIDGSAHNNAIAYQFYSQRSDTQISIPKLVKAWIEPETIDALISSNGFRGEVDLLTIDLDGVDYWVWKNITSINPRVVVTEYIPWFGPNEPYTVKNIKGFYYPDYAETKMGYCGCSLSAHVKLAHEKGYRLIGCNRNQLNAVFLRNDIAPELFPEVSEQSCLNSRRITDMTNWIRPMVQKQIDAGDWELV